MSNELTAGELERLSGLLGRSGLDFSEARWPFLRTRALDLMARRGLGSARDFVSEVAGAAGRPGWLYRELEEALRVQATAFFRYPAHHRILAELVLPEVATAAPDVVRLLSVGCSTGEEPYSVAMTALERLEGLPAGRLEILGLDASAAAVAVARTGVYDAAAVATVPPRQRARHFVARGLDVAVAPELRRLVRFYRHDLRTDVYLGRFEAVFCCNVLFYFTPAIQRVIVDRLTAALARGGYLFLGHAEGFVPPPDRFRRRPFADGVVYQRI